MSFKCIWWYYIYIYLGVISCVLLYMSVYSEDLGLSWRGLCHCLQHRRLFLWHPRVSGGGRIGGVVALSIQWKVGVVTTYPHMYAICCLVCVCMYVCYLTIKKSFHYHCIESHGFMICMVKIEHTNIEYYDYVRNLKIWRYSPVSHVLICNYTTLPKDMYIYRRSNINQPVF